MLQAQNFSDVFIGGNIGKISSIINFLCANTKYFVKKLSIPKNIYMNTSLNRLFYIGLIFFIHILYLKMHAFFFGIKYFKASTTRV